MDGPECTGSRSSPNQRPRYPGWAALLVVLAVALLLIGAMLLGMMQAPVPRQRTIVTASVTIAAGLILLPIAWLGRRKSRR